MELLSTQPNIGIGDTGTPPSDQVVDPYQATTMKEMSVKDIIPTTPVGDTDPIVTDLNANGSGTMLLSSYSDHVTDSSQFPMQHATQKLSGKTVSMTTTDYSTKSPPTVSPLGALNSTITTSESADSSHSTVSSSQALSEGLTDSLSDTSSPSTVPLAAAGSGSSDKDSTDSSYEPSVSESNSATGYISSSSSNVLSLTSTDTQQNVSKQVLDSSKGVFIHATQSVDYVASTGDLFSPVTPSKTVFSTSGVTIESSSFKSTSAIPLTPGGKSINTVDSGGTAFFGGGFTDYILYIGVPACGLVILIFLIVCLVCLRKRKAKNKGSPMKNHVQDLWVNSQQEVALTTRDPLREINGRENIGGHKDLVVRRRKKNQRIKIKGGNALDFISQTFDTNENIENSPIPLPKTIEMFDEIDKELESTDFNEKGGLNDNMLYLEGYIEGGTNDINSALNDLDDMLDLEDGFVDSTNDIDSALNDLDDILRLEDGIGDSTNGKESALNDLDDNTNDIASALYDLDNMLDLEEDVGDIDLVDGCYTEELDDEIEDQGDEVDSEDTLTGDEGTVDPSDDDFNTGGDQITGCTTYEAVFDFHADLETHLTLKQGDLVRVHRKEGNGWWRGTVGEHSGWFPNSYIQAAPQDKLETEDEIEMNGESNVSSFMAQPRYPPSLRDSMPSEKDIEVEPIYCKIQPKEKRKSFPKVPDKTPPKGAPPNRENATTPLEDGSKYIAIYSYGGHFTGELTINKGDIIQGKELDRNGWMRGYNETTKHEGWCPTVHVDRLDKDEIKQLEPSPLPTSVSLTSLTPDPLTYKQLESNQSTDGMKDWVGIVHKAVHDFNAEKAGDLEFEKGDLVTVFQVLENGWWLGSKGKSVGWFPGSLVEMIPQPSPRIPSLRSAPSPSNTSQTSNSPVSSDEGRSITDGVSAVSPSKPAKLKPVRKAPPPPLRLDVNTNTRIPPPSSPSLPSESNESKIPTPTLNKTPKIPRPMKVAPPAPPVREEPIDHSPLYEAIGKGKTEHISGPILIQTTRNDGLYDLIQHTNGELNEQPKDKSKPEVPKRYIKPKLVKIPRSEIDIPSTGPPTGGIGSPNIARPRVPPPPRPSDPPKVSLESLKVNGGSLDDDIKDHKESETFFHLPPQNKLGYIPKQDSTEQELDETPYNGMSSFGSSFGSTFGKRPEKMENKDFTVHIHENKLANLDNYYEKPIEQITQSNINNVVKENDKQGIMVADQTFKHNTGSDIRSEKSDSDNADDILVQSIEDKPVKTKEKGISRIPPPKHISQAEETKLTAEIDTNETNVVEKQMPKQSRLPMSRKDSPAKHEAKKDSMSESENYHSVNKKNEQMPEINQNKMDDIAVIDYTDITKGDNVQVNQQEVNHNDIGDEAMRMRSESFNKPPVAPKPRSKGVPKVLAKPVNRSKSPDISTDVDYHDAVNTENITNVEQGKTDAFVCESSEIKTVEDKQPKVKESPKVSKLTKIAQKSPKPKKSGIPASPLMRMKHSEKQTRQVNKQKLSESDSDVPLSPTIDPKNKPESPAMARRSAAKQIANSEHNIRNRSNSPHGRTGIPTSLKQRSNSPASKLPRGPNTPSPGTPSPAHTPTLISKPRGLVPPKKIQTPKDNHSPISEPSSPMYTTQSPDTSFDNTDDDLEIQPTSPKPERPSKPPRVVKQKSPDGKPPKHGRSLLPMIHKTMDGTNDVLLPGTKPKSGIPVSKPPRPPAPNSPEEDTGISGPTLFQAVRGYTAQSEEELSFVEGTFVTELSECDRQGWYVGMLADGTTGLYPAHCFKPNPLGSQSEA